MKVINTEQGEGYTRYIVTSDDGKLHYRVFEDKQVITCIAAVYDKLHRTYSNSTTPGTRGAIRAVLALRPLGYNITAEKRPDMYTVQADDIPCIVYADSLYVTCGECSYSLVDNTWTGHNRWEQAAINAVIEKRQQEQATDMERALQACKAWLVSNSYMSETDSLRIVHEGH